MGLLYFEVEAKYDELVKLRNEVAGLEAQMRGLSQGDGMKIQLLESQLTSAKVRMHEMAQEAARGGEGIKKAIMTSGQGTQGLLGTFRNLTGEVKNFGNVASGVLSKVESGLGAIASIGVGAGFGAILTKLFKVRSMFQDIESSMGVFLKSEEKSKEFVQNLQDYAWYNMFEFSELTQASSQLLAYGNTVDEIMGASGNGKNGILDRLSNIASGTNKSLMQFVEMYNRAKSIGYVDSRAQMTWASSGVVLKDVLADMGEQANGTKITFDQLNKAINQLTDEGGMFAGLMDAKMQNLSASYGQLQDDIDIMFNKIGETMQGAMKTGIDWADSVVANYEVVGEALGKLIATYGAFKVASASAKYMNSEDSIFKKASRLNDDLADQAIAGSPIDAGNFMNQVTRFEKEALSWEYKNRYGEENWEEQMTEQETEHYQELLRLAEQQNMTYAGAKQIKADILSQLDEEIATTKEYGDIVDQQTKAQQDRGNAIMAQLYEQIDGLQELDQKAVEAEDNWLKAVEEGAPEDVVQGLKDAFDTANQDIADKINEAASESTDILTLAEERESVAANIQALTKDKETTATALNTLETRRNTAAEAMNGNTTSVVTLKDRLHTLAINVKTKAIRALNAAWKASPVGLILSAVSAITTLIGVISSISGLIKGWNKDTDENEESLTRFNDKLQDTTSSIDMYLGVMRHAEKDSATYRQAQTELLKIYDDAGLKIAREDATLEHLNETREKAIELIREEAFARMGAEIEAAGQKQKESAAEDFTNDIYDTISSASEKQRTKSGMVGMFDVDNASVKKDAAIAMQSIWSVYEQELEGLSGDALENKIMEMARQASQALQDAGVIHDAELAKGTYDENGVFTADMMQYDYSQFDEGFATAFKNYYESMQAAQESIDRGHEITQNIQGQIKTDTSELQAQNEALVKAQTDASVKWDNRAQEMFADGSRNDATYITQEALKKDAAAEMSLVNDIIQVGAEGITRFQANDKYMRDAIANSKTENAISEIISNIQAIIKSADFDSEQKSYFEELLKEAQQRQHTIKQSADDVTKGLRAIDALQTKNADLLRDHRRKKNKQEWNAEYEHRKSMVELMRDGTEKETETRKLELEKQLHDLEESKTELVDAEKSRQKAVFDAREQMNEQQAQNKGISYIKRNWSDSMYDTTYESQVINPQIERQRQDIMNAYAKGTLDLLKNFSDYESEREKREERIRKNREDQKAITQAIADIESQMHTAQIEGGDEALKKLRERLEIARQIADTLSYDSSRNDYYKEHGTARQRRMATGNEYDYKIQTARAQGDEWGAKALERQKQAELGKLDLDVLSSQNGWAEALGTLGDIFPEYVTKARDAVRKQIDSEGFKSMDIESQKALYDIYNQLTEKVGYSLRDIDLRAFGQAADDYKTAIENLQRAQAEEARRIQNVIDVYGSMDNARDLAAGGDEIAGNFVRLADRSSEDVTNKEKDVQGAENNLTESTNKAVGALTQFTDSLSKLSSDTLAGLAEGFQGLAESVGMTDFAQVLGDPLTQAILALFDLLAEVPLGELIGGMIENLLGQIGAIIGNSIGNLLSGQLAAQIGEGLINGVKSLAGNVLSGFGLDTDDMDWLKSDKERFEELAEETARLSDAMAKARDLLEEEFDESVGMEAAEKADEIKKTYETDVKNYRKLGEEYASTQEHWWSHSNGYEEWDDLDSTAKDYLESMGVSSIAGIFDMSVDQLKDLEKHSSVYTQLSDEVQGYIDKIVESTDAIEDMSDAVKEKLLGMSFDSMLSNFTSAMMDMESTAYDTAQDMSEYFYNALLSTSLTKKYKDRLQVLYDEMAASVESGAGTDSITALQAEYNSIVQEALAERDRIAELTGYDETYEQQTQGKTGYAAMSQETGDELNGRFTALQIAGEQIRALMEENSVNQLPRLTESLETLVLQVGGDVTNPIGNMISDIQTTLANSYVELQGINQNTGDMLELFGREGAIRKLLDTIKTNTDALSRR